MTQNVEQISDSESFRQMVEALGIREAWAVELLAMRIQEAVREIADLTREAASIAEAESEPAPPRR